MANKKTPTKGVKSTIQKETGEYKCSCCGVVYSRQQNNFFKSGSPLYAGNDGYTTHCRNCVSEYNKKLLGFYNGNAEKAMKHICSLFDIYYNENIFAATGKEATDSRVLSYSNKLNMIQFKANGKTFLETLSEVQDRPQAIENLETTEENIYRASPETIRFWGEGFSNEVYGSLQYAYDDWVERNGGAENISKAQELVLKQICMLELKIQKLNLEGDVKGVVSLTKTVQDLIKTGEFKPTPRKEKTDNDMYAGLWAQEIEKDEAIDDEAWTSEEIAEVHNSMTGHLCRVFDLVPPNQESYGKFISENSIEVEPREVGGFNDD